MTRDPDDCKTRKQSMTAKDGLLGCQSTLEFIDLLADQRQIVTPTGLIPSAGVGHLKLEIVVHEGDGFGKPITGPLKSLLGDVRVFGCAIPVGNVQSRHAVGKPISKIEAGEQVLKIFFGFRSQVLRLQGGLEPAPTPLGLRQLAGSRPSIVCHAAPRR